MQAKKIKSKPIPRFKNEDEERDFWSKHSLAEFIDQFEPVHLDLSKLKPSTETISLRLPLDILDTIKILARAKDVPYQSLMKMFIAERVEQELKKQASR